MWFQTPPVTNKIFFIAFTFLEIYYLCRDVQLFTIIQQIQPHENTSEQKLSQINCQFTPSCEITVKALLLDHLNYYILAPIVKETNRLLNLSNYFSPNFVSVFHIFVAALSALCIINKKLNVRRIGVLLFVVRDYLDDLDGYIARFRRHTEGEYSEIGSLGFYIDGVCDFLGIVALMVACAIFLDDSLPLKGYTLLPLTGNKYTIFNRFKIFNSAVKFSIICFSLQLFISSATWNRNIDVYQNLLKCNFSKEECEFQLGVYKSFAFHVVSFLWRIVNPHNAIVLLLYAIFCDKMWEFFKYVKYLGFIVLGLAIWLTELHLHRL